MRLPIRSIPSDEMLGHRGRDLVEAGKSLHFAKPILQNPYDPEKNPNGFVNIGVSENYVMLEEVSEFVNKRIQFEPRDFSYNEGPWGTLRLQKAMAAYITRHFHPKQPINIEDLIIANGVTSLCEMLAFAICDEGDGILLSRPIYQAFKGDFGTKAKVKSVFVEFGGIDQFTPAAIEKYKVALLKAREENIRIRCLVLCHPHNPLGQCYPVETLIAFMIFCQEYEIHLIVDEIYAMSVYDIPDPKTIKFESVLCLPTEKYIDPKYLHFIYGMSKDIAASGLRVGVLHSLNKELILAMSAITMFHWAGGASDKIAITMLEDEKWMDGFLQLGRERLAARNFLVRSLLDEAGVSYHHGANAGFFIWIDLRPFLRVKPDANVEDRWEAEKELLGRFIANKVYLTNGMEMSAEEPGWFRVIFSQEEWMIKEGLRRVMETAKTPA